MSYLNQELFENIFLMEIEEIQKNFECLGQGAGRIVFALDADYVIKLSKSKGGDMQSKNEKYTYIHARPYLKKYLCPVVWYRDDMLVMKRATELARRKSERHKNIFKLWNIKKDGIFYSDINELINTFSLLYGDVRKLSSWGLIDNKPVLIDYGCTERIFHRYFSH